MAPRPNILSIVAGTIPATIPRQPQMDYPTTAFLMSASTIGVQSAASATSAIPADLVTSPSHLPAGVMTSSVTSCTLLPCSASMTANLTLGVS